MGMTMRGSFGTDRKNRQRYVYWFSVGFNVLALLSIPVLEIAFDHYLFSGYPSALGDFLTFKGYWFYPLIFYAAALLFLLRLGTCILGWIGQCRAVKHRQAQDGRGKSRKLRDRLIPLLRSIVSLDPVDITATILFLIHLTWIPDSLFDYMKEASYCLLHPLIFMLGFVCILFFVAQQKRGDTNKQTVLFTGLSHPSLSTLIAFFRPLAERFRDIKEIVVFVDRNVEIRTTGMPDDTALKPTACWDYLFDATRNDEEKTWLEKRYRLSTEKLDECGISRDALAKLEDNDDFANKTEEERLASLKTFLETACTACLGDGVTVELLECDYSSDINTLINQIQDEIRKRIRPRGTHADEELLFHLTPGALSISVALAFNAAKGMRKSCYIEQDRKKLMTYNLENVE